MTQDAPTTGLEATPVFEARGSYIHGEWRAVTRADGVLTRENPAALDQQLYAFPYRVADVDDAVRAARGAARSWNKLGFAARRAHMARFAEALQAREAQLARAITDETGKPLWEATGEARALVAKITIMSEDGARLVADVHPEGVPGRITHRPLGVLAVLGPFNFPLHLPNGHIIPALLYGNTVVIKPSELTAASMQLYVQCAHEAGLPPGVLNLVHGAGDTGARLATHDDVDAVLFTGSYDTGLRIKQATLHQPGKLLALEMGGKNTSILLPDADLEQAAHEIVQAAFLTTGQRCSATSRVVIHDSLFDTFVDRITALTDRVTTGHPILEDVFMGPITDRRAFQHFLAAQQDDERGRLQNIRPGGTARPDLNGYYVTPAIWAAREVDRHGTHQGQELFAPELVLYRFTQDDEAARIANATDFGLAMSVFTRDEDRFDDLAIDLKAGILNLNRSTVGASSKLPFGGVKKSGNHRPAALFAGYYCTYPQAQLRVAPGFDPATLGAGPLSKLSHKKHSTK